MRAPQCLALIVFVLMGISSASQDTHPQKPSAIAPAIPKTWDDEAIATLEVPLANPVGSPKHVSADYLFPGEYAVTGAQSREARQPKAILS
jgi:hypothetical protein